MVLGEDSSLDLFDLFDWPYLRLEEATLVCKKQESEEQCLTIVGLECSVLTNLLKLKTFKNSTIKKYDRYHYFYC